MITFDCLMLKAFIDEQKGFITGARINKIQQPTRRELILSLRNFGETKPLYININPKNYHICFMSEQNAKRRLIEIPQKPPMFCMLLRKYLQNSKIAKVNQPDGERILELYFETYNELNDKIYLCLAIELMGKYSNIILYNCDTDIILGCAHNVGAEKSSVREVYGQIPYTYPPKQEVNSFLQGRYSFLKSFKNDVFPQDSMNTIIDNYYSSIIEREKFNTLKDFYYSKVQSKLNKVNKSLKEMLYQIDKNSDAEKYRLYGDLLMANLYYLKDYSACAEVFDYENNKQINIKLDETKTIKDNANKFYKKYNKSKTAGIKLRELIEGNKQNKEYLESILYSVEIAQNIDELNEIEAVKYPPLDTLTRNTIEYRFPSGQSKALPSVMGITCIEKEYQTRIYIGKNNKQNDYIISKLAAEDDLWFHTKDCPGSHVLLKTQNLTDDLIFECARLAKKYSLGFDATKVAVIYTKRKYLRKPPKAHLGYVTYKNEKEIIV